MLRVFVYLLPLVAWALFTQMFFSPRNFDEFGLVGSFTLIPVVFLYPVWVLVVRRVSKDLSPTKTTSSASAASITKAIGNAISSYRKGEPVTEGCPACQKSLAVSAEAAQANSSMQAIKVFCPCGACNGTFRAQ